MDSSASSPKTIHGITLAGLLVTVASLAGCAGNLSGVGGETTFKCKAPDGVQCQSVSGTYANAWAGNLPSQQSSPPQASAPAWTPAPGDLPTMAASALPGPASPPDLVLRRAPRPQAAMPFGAIRSDPTLIRIWLAPWEDSDGDLMDQTYVYLPLDSGRWLIEHNRQRIKREFAPVRAPAGAAQAPSPQAAAKSVSARVPHDDDEAAPDGAAALAAGINRLRSGARTEASAPEPPQ